MKIVHKTDLQQITFLDERFYLDEKTGTYCPSATTVLDVYPKGYGFMQWLKDMGTNSEEVLRRAGEQGSKIHDAIERFLNHEQLTWTDGERENFTLDEWTMLLRFYEFWTLYKPQVLAVELSMVDVELGFGGTLDLVCKLNVDNYKDVWYIDWKSGNAIYKTNKIQGAAYQKLWNKQKDIKIDHVACMHLKAMTRGESKTKGSIQGLGWKLEVVDDTEHLFKLFEHAQALWIEENPNAKPKNLIYPDRIMLDEEADAEAANAEARAAEEAQGQEETSHE